MKKKIFIGLGIAAVVIILGLFFLMKNLNAIVKVAIEKVGTSVIGTEVSLKSADVVLNEGRATLKGLDIANPDGFSRSPLFHVGEMTAQLEIKTGVIKEIYIGSPQIRFEQKGAETNFSAIQKNLGSEPSEKPEKEESKEEQKELQIDLFKLENADVVVTSDQFKDEKKLVIKEITLKNLKGTPSRIGWEITTQIVGQTITTVTKEVLGSKAREELGGKLFKKGE